MRHQHPVNLLLHIVGIPLVIMGIFLLFKKRWTPALASIIAGYLFQYLGHLLFEHNQMGEVVLIMGLINKMTGQ